MAKFTLLETVVFHRMLWAELADTGIDFKTDAKFWDEHKINKYEITCNCFPCNFNDSHCGSCIFDWGNNFYVCCGENAPFKKWDDSDLIEDRKKYAALIRDIPLKPEYAKELGE